DARALARRQLVAPAVARVNARVIAAEVALGLLALRELRQRDRRVELLLLPRLGLRRQRTDDRLVALRRDDARRRAPPLARAAHRLAHRHRQRLAARRHRSEADRAAEHLRGRARGVLGTLDHVADELADDVVALAERVLVRTLDEPHAELLQPL